MSANQETLGQAILQALDLIRSISEEGISKDLRQQRVAIYSHLVSALQRRTLLTQIPEPEREETVTFLENLQRKQLYLKHIAQMPISERRIFIVSMPEEVR